jgi:hypothetical protein
LTRLLFFCQLMALGLVAASVYLPFPNDLNRAGGPVVTLDQFSGALQKTAIFITHKRVTWIVLAVCGVLTSLAVYRTRFAPRRNRWVAWAPAALLLVVAVHCAAQGWLQAHGSLHLEFHGNEPTPLASTPLTEPAATGSQPFQLQVRTITSITRLTIPEGTPTQWQALFGGDLLFSVPLLFAWVLSFARQQRGTPA